MTIGACHLSGRFRADGLLVQHGERGGTSYSLVEDGVKLSPWRPEQEAQQEVVLRFAGEEPVTNTLVRERLDLARRQAVELPRSLVDGGQLVAPARSAAPDTRYRADPRERSTTS